MGGISIATHITLKLVDLFIFFSRNISSPESDISIHMGKASTYGKTYGKSIILMGRASTYGKTYGKSIIHMGKGSTAIDRLMATWKSYLSCKTK